MKVAIPLAEGKLAMHFGHCSLFAIISVDDTTKQVVGREDLVPPPHEPGVLPKWLAEQGVNIIIAGGMGNRAQMLFTQSNINVLVGAPSESPEELVKSWTDGSLTTGTNMCDH